MSRELLRFETDGAYDLIVEVDADDAGYRPVGRGEAIAEARKRFEAALGSVRDAADRALQTFRDGTLKPDGIEIEFGVKFNAEAGAVLAKTAAEGHLVVKLTWSPGSQSAA